MSASPRKLHGRFGGDRNGQYIGGSFALLLTLNPIPKLHQRARDKTSRCRIPAKRDNELTVSWIVEAEYEC